MTKTSRKWRASWAILGGLAAVLAVTACDSSETIDKSGNGTGGAGGAAGASGSAGSPATGGAAGASGSGGSSGAGAGGQAGGGAGGQAGTEPKVIHHAFSADGHDRLYDVAFDADGKILAVGVRADGIDAATDLSTLVARFTPDGALDPSFGSGGSVVKNLAVGTTGEVARGIAVQSTGKIVVAATVEAEGAADPRDRNIALARFLPDGALDTSFGTAGVVVLDLSAGVADGTAFSADMQWGLALASGDKLVISGAMVASGRTDTDYALVRLDADGARDASFGTNGVFSLDIGNAPASARRATVLADDSVVLAGYRKEAGAVLPVVFKVTAAGVLDTTFGVGGVFSEAVLAATTEAYDAVVQGDKLVTIGYGRENTTDDLDWISLRLTASGTLDPTWGTGGHVLLDAAGFNDNGRALTALPDGRVLMVGGGRTAAAESDAMLAILANADGAPDASFGPGGIRLLDLGGPNDFLWSVAVQPGGKLAVAAGIAGANSDSGAGPLGDDDAALVLVPLP